jgi:hypothetical protein
MSELDIINIINVSVSEAPVGLSDYKVNNIAYFTNETPVVGLEAYGDYGVYVSPAAVAEDFGSGSEAYKAANAIFAQNPNMSAGGGVLIIFPMLTLAAGAVSSASLHTAGSGYSVGDVLTVVQSGGSLCTLTVTSVDTDGEILAFEITTAGSGYSVADDLETTVSPSGGTGCTVNILAVGSGAETLLQAITRCKALVYFVGILSNAYPSSDGDRLALAAAVQALPDKMLALPSNDSADITGVFTDIKDASDSHTRCLYYGGTAQEARLFAAAAFGRGMGVNFDGSRTTNTLHMKPLATITPDDTVNQTLLTALETAGVDAYVNVAGISMYWSNGENRYFDEVFNLIWFVSQLKVNGFNALRELSTKIPQTEPGMVSLKAAYRLACEQAIRNGMIAPGAWTSAEWFGNQEDMYSNIEERGYYIYSLPVNLQSSSDRADRKAPVVQIGIKLAGALHSSEVMVNFNR